MVVSSAEQRLQELGIELPHAPTPLGAYVMAVQTGRLLFLTGMLSTVGHEAAYRGRLGAELDAEDCGRAARVAALNVLAVARAQLGSLDNITRVVRLTVFIATAGEPTDLPRIADGASEVLRDVLGPETMSARTVIGVASLPLNVPIELEAILEVQP
jgi:enamine deaminase RidA (YjgF/YER057c/UK114 family)